MPREAKLGATRDSYVYQIRVPAEMRAQWEEHCAKEKRKPSVTIRLLMRYMMKGDMPEVVRAWLDGQTTGEPDYAAKQRVEVRLTQSEYEAIKTRADAEQSSVQHYIVSCIRASLTNEPQLTMTAVTALSDSNRQLRAIGRNLNQIAKAVNSGGDFHATVAQLRNMEAFIKQHAEAVSGVVRASLGRWKIANQKQ